jgi:hypothetical protein
LQSTSAFEPWDANGFPKTFLNYDRRFLARVRATFGSTCDGLGKACSCNGICRGCGSRDDCCDDCDDCLRSQLTVVRRLPSFSADVVRVCGFTLVGGASHPCRYHYSLSHQAYRSGGVSMMRPLLWAYPDDPIVAEMTSQWFDGEHLMAARHLFSPGICLRTVPSSIPGLRCVVLSAALHPFPPPCLAISDPCAVGSIGSMASHH